MVVAYFINFKSDPQMHNERGLIELIKLYDTNKRSLKSEYWYANYRFSSFSCVFVFRTVLNFMHADIICEGLLDYNISLVLANCTFRPVISVTGHAPVTFLTYGINCLFKVIAQVQTLSFRLSEWIKFGILVSWRDWKALVKISFSIAFQVTMSRQLSLN